MSVPGMSIPRASTAANIHGLRTAAMIRDAAHMESQVAGMSLNLNPPTKGLNVPGLKIRGVSKPTSYVAFAPREMRGTVVAWIGEFLGTFLFLFFAFAGTEVANDTTARELGSGAGPSAAALLYIALAFGMSLMVNVWAFFRITGGMFNPAVSFGLALIGGITWTRMLVAWTAQFVGGIAAAALVSGLFPGKLSVATTLATNTSVVRGFFIEAILTAELIFVIFMLAAEKNKATFLAPIGIGLALFIAELAGVAFTGGSLNPARSFGPAVVMPSFPTYHWIYWMGPFLGALSAVGAYKVMRGLEYEVNNPNAADLDRLQQNPPAVQSPMIAANMPAAHHLEHLIWKPRIDRMV